MPPVKGCRGGPYALGLGVGNATRPERPAAYNPLTSLRSSNPEGVRNLRPLTPFQGAASGRGMPLKSVPAPLLTVREAAARLQVKPVTVYRLCRGEAAAGTRFECPANYGRGCRASPPRSAKPEDVMAQRKGKGLSKGSADTFRGARRRGSPPWSSPGLAQNAGWKNAPSAPLSSQVGQKVKVVRQPTSRLDVS
jgi:hypothetical protein